MNRTCSKRTSLTWGCHEATIKVMRWVSAHTSMMVSSLGARFFSTSSFSRLSIMGFKMAWSFLTWTRWQTNACGFHISIAKVKYMQNNVCWLDWWVCCKSQQQQQVNNKLTNHKIEMQYKQSDRYYGKSIRLYYSFQTNSRNFSVFLTDLFVCFHLTKLL